jgi:hypothetical protein
MEVNKPASLLASRNVNEDHAKRNSGGRSRGGGLIVRRGGYHCPTRQNAPADDSRPVSASAAQGLSPTFFLPPTHLPNRSLCVARVRSPFLSPSLPPHLSLSLSLSFPLSLPPSISPSPHSLISACSSPACAALVCALTMTSFSVPTTPAGAPGRLLRVISSEPRGLRGVRGRQSACFRLLGSAQQMATILAHLFSF